MGEGVENRAGKGEGGGRKKEGGERKKGHHHNNRNEQKNSKKDSKSPLHLPLWSWLVSCAKEEQRLHILDWDIQHSGPHSYLTLHRKIYIDFDR